MAAVTSCENALHVEGNSYFLPECIAFNQSALHHFLPECIAPRRIRGCHDRCQIMSHHRAVVLFRVDFSGDVCSGLPVKRREEDRA